jgi:hypothetical protein
MENGESTTKTCKAHDKTTITYEGDKCPLCTADARLGPGVNAIIECGKAIVGLFVASGGQMNVNLGIFHAEHEPLAKGASDKISQALTVLAQAMKGDAEPSRIIRPNHLRPV